MSDKKYSTNDLKPGTTIVVEGQVRYSRIASIITMEEIEEKRKRDPTKHYPERPYLFITIDQAKYVSTDGPNPEVVSGYVNERLFVAKSQQALGGLSWDQQDKSGRLPWLALCPDGVRILRQETPKAELARGLRVRLVLRVYSSKQQNNGIGLEGIIVLEDEIRYYRPGAASALEALGFAVENGVTFERVEAAPPQVPQVPNPFEQPAAGAPVADAYAQQAYQQGAPAAPAADPYAQQAYAQQAYQQQAPAADPYAQQAYQQQAYQQPQQAYAPEPAQPEWPMPPVPAAPAQPDVVAMPQPPAATPGIAYSAPAPSQG